MAMLQAKTRGRGRVAIFDAGPAGRGGQPARARARPARRGRERRTAPRVPAAGLARQRAGARASRPWCAGSTRVGACCCRALRGPGRGVRAHHGPRSVGARGRLRPDGALAGHVPRGQRLVPGRQRLAPANSTASSSARRARRAREERPAPGALMLEITESGIVSDDGHLHSMLEELREFGVRLAIDDFGTGYSSLSYLKRLAGELHQGRPLLRDGARAPTPRTSASWPPSPNWATGSGCGSSPKASRTVSSATWPASWAATSTRATCWPSRVGPATSRPSGGPGPRRRAPRAEPAHEPRRHHRGGSTRGEHLDAVVGGVVGVAQPEHHGVAHRGDARPDRRGNLTGTVRRPWRPRGPEWRPREGQAVEGHATGDGGRSERGGVVRVPGDLAGGGVEGGTVGSCDSVSRGLEGSHRNCWGCPSRSARSRRGR